MRVTGTMIAALLMLGPAASAAELSPELRSLIEGFQAHRRTAMGYLRTQNADLGAVEVERLRDRLAADARKAAPTAPNDLALTLAIARTEALIESALKAADGGDIGRSRTLLEEAGKPLDGWRAANGIRMLSDCIAEIGAAYEALDGDRQKAPDLTDDAAGRRIVAAAGRTAGVLDRCEREAPASLRDEQEFRRLFDGMRESLKQMPHAVRTRDGALLHRLLIEQRSFEQLLAFRFG